MRLSLRWRISIPFVLLILITSGTISFFLYHYFEGIYLENIRSDNLQLARSIALQVETNDSGVLQSIQKVAQRYSWLDGCVIAIMAPDSRVTAVTNRLKFYPNPDDYRMEVQTALSGQETSTVIRPPEAEEPVLVVFVPVTEHENVVGVVWLARSLKSYDDQMAYSWQIMILLVGGGVLLSILLVMLLSNYTIHPLRQLTQAAHWMAEGDFTRVALNNQADEIGQLNQAFNQMASQINTQVSELTAERVKLAAVLSNMNDGIMIVDKEGITRLINPACLNMFDFTDDVPTGIPLVEVVRSHQIYDLWQRCQKSGQQTSQTFELSPNRQFINAIASPLSSTPPGNVLLVFQDLTRLHHLELVRRDFVSNVSHELRTPLASLKALTETLREGALDDPETAKRFLLRMEIEIDALAQIVQELLELSRIESGKATLDKQNINPSALIQAAFDRMQHQAERAGISLSIKPADELPDVYADKARIIQVMVNLLHNAIKFTSPGGAITISAVQKKRMVVFSIQDTGIGIEPEALPRIFERFYKVDRARSGEGTGLGLSISRHLIETHNGLIWAESEVGKGSIFYFSLPVG
jgi:two-component system phosphate regulon sensor histidine kinase PhoR